MPILDSFSDNRNKSEWNTNTYIQNKRSAPSYVVRSIDHERETSLGIRIKPLLSLSLMSYPISFTTSYTFEKTFQFARLFDSTTITGGGGGRRRSYAVHRFVFEKCRQNAIDDRHKRTDGRTDERRSTFFFTVGLFLLLPSRYRESTDFGWGWWWWRGGALYTRRYSDRQHFENN